MTFGLKNTCATYQRCNGASVTKIGLNIYTYVKDIAVMSQKGNELISNLPETFNNLPKYKMMLNPTNFF
jgi:hypothetical protein